MSGLLALDDVLERAASGKVAFEDVIESPIAIEPKPRTLYILDRRSEESGRPWHMLGWTIVVVGAAVLALVSGGGFFRDFGAMAAALMVGAVAVLLIRRGRPHVHHVEVPLLWLDGGLRMLRVREHPEQRDLLVSSNISFDDVYQVLFAQRSFQIPGARTAGRVDGAAVFLRLRDGAVWPVVPATLAKNEAYNIALGVAQRIGVGVKQVGSGWSDRG